MTTFMPRVSRRATTLSTRSMKVPFSGSAGCSEWPLSDLILLRHLLQAQHLAVEDKMTKWVLLILG